MQIAIQVIAVAALVLACATTCVITCLFFESLLTDYFLHANRLEFALKIAYFIPDPYMRRNQLAQIAYRFLQASQPNNAMDLFLLLIKDTRNEFDPVYGLPPIQTILEEVVASSKNKGYQYSVCFEAALDAIEMMSAIDKKPF